MATIFYDFISMIRCPTSHDVSFRPYFSLSLRPPQTRKHCCFLNVSPFARTGNICCGNIFCFRETKNVSDFFQKHFVFSTNVSPFARRGNNVSATVFPQQCFLVCGGLYSEASFNLTRIAVSGDVFVNPVPAATGNASVKCPICWKTVANRYRAVSCDTCLCWVHIKFGKITQRKYKELQNLSAFVWSFPGCVHNQTFPFASRNNVNIGFYADLAEQDGNAERQVHIYKSLRGDYLFEEAQSPPLRYFA